jgi:hypothetical protein
MIRKSVERLNTLQDLVTRHEIVRQWRFDAGWWAFDSGPRHFFKRLVAVPAATRWPVTWADLLVAAMLERVGLVALECSLVHLTEPGWWVLRRTAIEACAPGAMLWRDAAQVLPGHISDAMWRMFLLDLLIGNADRSLTNAWLIAQGERVAPFDHELSLLVPDVIAPGSLPRHFVAPPTASPFAPRRRSGFAAGIVNANSAYAQMHVSVRSERQRCMRIALEIQRALPAWWLRDAVEALPDEALPIAIPSRPAREYLVQTLEHRLVWLPEALTELQSNAPILRA